MDLENYFTNGKVYIWKETFSIIKSKKPYPNAFANIIDKNETTVIIEQSKCNDEDIIEIEKDWKIITFQLKKKIQQEPRKNFKIADLLSKRNNPPVEKNIK